MLPQSQVLEEASHRPSLWAEYVAELDEVETFEGATYFVTYKIESGFCHIYDVFVRKSARKFLSRTMMQIFMQSMKERGVEGITGSVNLNFKGATKRLTLWIRMGAEVIKADSNTIFLLKRI